MLDIRKWNYDTKEYDSYTPDPSWNIVLYNTDMSLAINCASCGLDMVYGDGYTSRELHNQVGFGYPVCEECYTNEWKRYKESEDK